MTALLWSFAAWCALALGQTRHHEGLAGSVPRAAMLQRWRVLGGLLLLAVVLQQVRQQGWAFGLLTVVGALFAGGIAAVLLLTWWPHRGAPALWVALLLGLWLIP